MYSTAARALTAGPARRAQLTLAVSRSACESERVEAASRRGNDIGATTYGSIKSILQNGLDKAYANSKAPDGPPIRHANIRGRGYYH